MMTRVSAAAMILACLATLAISCAPRGEALGAPSREERKEGGGSTMKETTKIATFAGGCFWCMEPPFDKLDGVISTVSGYTGGRTVDPTYEEVSSGTTGHAESLQV